jgi:cytochrome c biogenesis protein CcmG/thiol:disulfide interchange protein DsbE
MLSYLKKNLSNILFIIVLLILLVTGRLNVLGERVKTFFDMTKGDKIIETSFRDIKTQKEIKLSTLKGKVVIVNFWATWCPPCKLEIPSFIDLYKTYNKDGLEIIGVSVDQGGAESVLAFMKEKEINYPVSMNSQEIQKTFGEIMAVPTTFVLNQEGKIENKYTGFYIKSSFENTVRKLLKKD